MNTLAAPCRYEESIRRSRFIAHAARVRDEAESLRFHDSVADLKASHNCWAWRIDGRYRSNDDGEPASSAGRPILAAIEGRGLNQVMIVVTRHFGGIKLGVGGLIRAYGGTASKCLDRAKFVPIAEQSHFRLSADFALAESLHQLLSRFEIEKADTTFNEDGVVMDIRLREAELTSFRRALADTSHGRARIERLR